MTEQSARTRFGASITSQQDRRLETQEPADSARRCILRCTPQCAPVSSALLNATIDAPLMRSTELYGRCNPRGLARPAALVNQLAKMKRVGRRAE